MTSLQDKIDRTYGTSDLARRLLSSMAEAGLDLNQLTTRDLIAFDELHIMGRQATKLLGERAGLTEGMRVLDLGSGLGGPARTLAETFGCHVTGVDLSAAYVQAAADLSRRVGLEGRVAFRRADALALPFGNNGFDAVLMFHLNMNIADKTALFKEALRVLKSGGCLALWEICGGSGPVIYPVPWAENEAFSHLVSINSLVDHLRVAGAVGLDYEDATEEAAAWVKARLAAMQKPRTGRPAPDLDLVLNNFRARRANVSKNLLQGNIRVLRAFGSAPK